MDKWTPKNWPSPKWALGPMGPGPNGPWAQWAGPNGPGQIGKGQRPRARQGQGYSPRVFEPSPSAPFAHMLLSVVPPVCAWGVEAEGSDLEPSLVLARLVPSWARLFLASLNAHCNALVLAHTGKNSWVRSSYGRLKIIQRHIKHV